MSIAAPGFIGVCFVVRGFLGTLIAGTTITCSSSLAGEGVSGSTGETPTPVVVAVVVVVVVVVAAVVVVAGVSSSWNGLAIN